MRRLIERASVDVYGENEQHDAFLVMLQEHIACPFTALVVGKEIEVRRFDWAGVLRLARRAAQCANADRAGPDPACLGHRPNGLLGVRPDALPPPLPGRTARATLGTQGQGRAGVTGRTARPGREARNGASRRLSSVCLPPAPPPLSGSQPASPAPWHRAAACGIVGLMQWWTWRGASRSGETRGRKARFYVLRPVLVAVRAPVGGLLGPPPVR